MPKMKLMSNWLIYSLLFVCCTFGMTRAQAAENCSLTTPPRDSAVTANHGAFLFVFPRKLHANYSGCQTMWNERGAIVFVLKFDRGAVVSYQEFAKPERKATLFCKYNGHVLKTRHRKCPPYEDIEAGFRTLPMGEEPLVPVEIDPRRD